MSAEQELEHRDFIFCEVCSWCASSIDHAYATRCPICKSSRLVKLPVK